MKIAATIAIALTCATASAQQLKVSTGTPKGTYATELREMQAVCGQEVAMVDVASTGAVENLERLINNEVNMAFVQSDLLYRRAKVQDLGGVKTLLALHKEQLHFIVRNEVLKRGGTLGFGATEYRLQSVDQLAGLRLAAGGGAIETAKQFRTDSEVDYKLVETKDSDAALAALVAKQADAALLVGGAPLGNIKGLDSNYVLLAVPPAIADRVKGAYKPARVTYTKMGAQGVPTVAIDALLVTREYKTEKMVGALGRFRQCVLSKIDELKETTGTHPAWQSVDPANRGTWNWYTLPAVSK